MIMTAICGICEKQGDYHAHTSRKTLGLNDNQRKLFHTYNDLQNEYHARTEQNAFVDGIHFAAEFLTEAVRGAK